MLYNDNNLSLRVITMRIAICDDKLDQLQIIKTATLDYFKSHNDIVEIDTFHQAFDFLDAHQKSKYDLVLLDICMPGLLGTEVAREIRLNKDNTEIIFLTTSNEFAIDAFEVNALHYILKPFSQEVFNKAMDRAMHQIDNKKTKMLYLKCQKGALYSVDKNAISYIESSAHRQTVVLNDGTIIETVETLLKLNDILKEIAPNQYITPYKGYIVNQHAISAIESDKLVLKNGKHIPIPRRTFNMIKQTYFDYMFDGRK